MERLPDPPGGATQLPLTPTAVNEGDKASAEKRDVGKWNKLPIVIGPAEEKPFETREERRTKRPGIDY